MKPHFFSYLHIVSLLFFSKDIVGRDASFGYSSKGKPTVMFASFEFTKHRDNGNGTTVWGCSKTTKFNCKARLTTLGTKIINVQNEQHTHKGNNSNVLARKAASYIKEAIEGIGATPY